MVEAMVKPCSDLRTPSGVQSDMDALMKRKRSPSSSRVASDSGISDNGRVFLPAISPSKRPRLTPIEIPDYLNTGLQETTYSPESSSSLFSAADTDTLFDVPDTNSTSIASIQDVDTLASRTAPPIPGLFFQPTLLLPQEIADSVTAFCMSNYFHSPPANQTMLFGRFIPPGSCPSEPTSGLPKILSDLLDTLSTALKPVIPPKAHNLLFPTQPTRARQAIINLYQPGEGITPHVDLLGRYDDGIIGVSLSSGCAMRFEKVLKIESDDTPRWDVYLPERSVIVLTEEARYDWTHGIDKKLRDFVAAEDCPDGVWISRGVRMSVTFRWLLPDADVVGPST